MVDSDSFDKDNECVACPEGKYNSEDNSYATSCIDKLSSCDQGKFFVESFSTTENNKCEPCADGTFMDKSNHTEAACKVWTTCPPGQGRNTTTGMSKELDVECHECTDPDDYLFSLGEDYSACNEHSQCDKGFGSNLQSLL